MDLESGCDSLSRIRGERIDLFASDQRVIPSAVGIVDSIDQCRSISSARRFQLEGDGRGRFGAEQLFISVQGQEGCWL